MIKVKSFVFVSIDGMTDPLGQSQVLPYLISLASKGYRISIVSCEKKENWELYQNGIYTKLNSAGITWNYCFYKVGRPFISQLQNYKALKELTVTQIISNTSNTVLHCRSYLAGLIGLYCKKKYNTGFIFDMRGFWADERVEGGIWNKKSVIGGLLYSYFKNQEKKMLLHADSVVVLTDKAKSIISGWKPKTNDAKIFVIPCCVDLEHFSENKLDKNKLLHFKNQFSKFNNQFVLSYVGSLGTWYMINEMLDFFKILSQKVDATFLIITKDSVDDVKSVANTKQIDINKIEVVNSSRDNMPYFIAMSTCSIFFIQPTFSKLASSPTKMGELLAMGVPIITNSGIGDVDAMINETNSGCIIEKFSDSSYEKAINLVLKKYPEYKENTICTAENFFSLEKGVATYQKVYKLF